MVRVKFKGFLLWFAVIILAIILVGIFLAFGPPRLMEKTSKPKFCANCHVMELQYEAWSRSSHQKVWCVDCHLPHDSSFSYYLWKGIDGTKDLIYFYSGLVPKEIYASPHARRTIKANCIRCHQTTVSRINTEGKKCWECHRDMVHKIQLLEERLK